MNLNRYWKTNSGFSRLRTGHNVVEAHAVHQFFFQLMVILLTARLLGELFARLQSPPVVGELLAGVILGPSLLAWLEPSQVIKLLAEIGIILLLFEVGLDTDIRQLAKTGWKALFVASSGFLWPFVFGFGLSHWLFERSLLESLFIGGTLTATSIGITVRVLTDLKRQHSREAQVVLGAAVIDDILGVVLLAVLYDFSLVGQVNTANVMQVIGFIAMFFVLAPLFAKAISLIIRQFAKISQTEGLIPTLIVSLVLFFAWLAHEMGAPELLGGFAAGLALSRRFFLPFGLALHEDSDFSGRIEAQMLPIIQLFVPIFFVMVGLSLNLRKIDWASSFIWWFSASLFAAAVLGKLLGALLLSGPWKERWAIGIAMIPRGEVGLIFAELGRTSGILNNDIYAVLIIVIAMTTLMSPILLKSYYRYLK
ncbi:MAG: cation:proton antiporter [Methylomonas sp.]|nr:cation:proton antiporter [Methylomonas sp.]